MKSAKDQSGMIIVTILIMTILLMILGSAMIAVNYENLAFATVMERKEKALRVAEAGVSYAIYSLTLDIPQWGMDRDHTPSVCEPMEKVNGKFEITFDKNKDYFSSNRLAQSSFLTSSNTEVWGGAGFPKYSFDLIVTGTVRDGSNTTLKRLRILLQRNANFGAAFATGMLGVSSHIMDVSKESTAQNPSEAGNIHSNSIQNPAIKTVGYNPFKPITTNVFLHGGKASAQGNIDITNANLDTVNGSMVDLVKQAKQISPIDIDETIDFARNRSDNNIIKVSGGTYVVYKDHIEPTLSNDTSAVEVINGKVYIKKDILFSGNDVRFEFNYNDLKTLSKAEIKASAIYLGDPSDSSKQPSLYVDNGKNILIAGAIKGNGGIFSAGSASLIGESNLVGPADPGVVIISKKDLNIQLPSVSNKPLGVDYTGLIYTHGNVNIDILEPNDPTNPANNFSSGGGWPPDWEELYFNPLTVKTNEIASNKDASGTPYGKNVFENSSTKTVTTTHPNCGLVISTITTTESWLFTASSGYGNITQNDNGSYTFEPGNNSSGLSLTYNDGSINVKALSFSNSVTITPNQPLASSLDPNIILTAEKVDSMITSINTYFQSYARPSGKKLDPNFRMTGAVVAIDETNPIPDSNHPDSSIKGNIKININKHRDPYDPNEPGGDFFVKYAPRYLKLLQAAKTVTSYKCVYWSEI